MYINHIDIDESGIKNVLQHYDIKYKSLGILTKYNNFNTILITITAVVLVE